MHAKARSRVHFADAAADGAVALGDVLRQEVHAADIQADGANGALGHLAIVGMNHVGDVGGGAAGREVGGRAQVHDRPLRRHRLGRESGALEHLLRLRIELQAREHLLVADAAARVQVHDVDELRDGVLAVADHVPGRTPGRGDELAVHHQQAVIVALEEALHDHRARMLARDVEAMRDLLVGGETDGNAAAVVAVVGLGDHRETHALGGAHRLALALHHLLLGHRQPEAGQDLVGLLLVARQLHRDMRGAPGDRGLDALLVLAVTELHQRLLVQAQPRNAARFGGAHQ